VDLQTFGESLKITNLISLRVKRMKRESYRFFVGTKYLPTMYQTKEEYLKCVKVSQKQNKTKQNSVFKKYIIQLECRQKS